MAEAQIYLMSEYRARLRPRSVVGHAVERAEQPAAARHLQLVTWARRITTSKRAVSITGRGRDSVR